MKFHSFDSQKKKKKSITQHLSRKLRFKNYAKKYKNE